MALDTNSCHSFALALAPQAASVANYCDHVEHNEVLATGWVTGPADELRRLALEFAQAASLDLVDLYAERLGMIEAKNVLARSGAFDGLSAARSAATWRDLQIVQVDHDRCYHPDVVGLAKIDQLRHYALHLAKIVGAFATPAASEDLVMRRLPDTLLFAMKLQTVMGKRLPDEQLPHAVRVPAAAGASVSRSAIV